MTKLLQLEKGCLYVRKDNSVVYITHEKALKNDVVQSTSIPDEETLSILFHDGLSSKPKVSKKAPKKTGV